MYQEQAEEKEAFDALVAQDRGLEDAYIQFQDARNLLNDARKARGFEPLDVPVPKNIKDLVSRVRCWNCLNKGHFKKDCKAAKSVNSNNNNGKLR